MSDKLPYMKVMRGELNYNQTLDVTLAARDREDVPQFERISAIVEIYFPELASDVDALFEARDSAAHIEASYRAQYKTGHVDGSMFLAPMRSALDLIDERAERLQVRVAEIARALWVRVAPRDAIKCREVARMRTTWASLILIGYGLFIGLMLSPAVAAPIDTKSMLGDFLPQLVATLAGVLAGAYIALHIEERRAVRTEHERRAAAANLAVHTLARMHSEQQDFISQVIDPVREQVPLWYHLKPSDIRVLPPPQFDWVSLQFLFRSGDPGIVGALSIEESRFANLVELVRRRNTTHMTEVYPKVEAHVRAAGRASLSLDELEYVVGPRTLAEMQDYTKAIIDFCDRGIGSTRDIASALYRAAKPMVGREAVIQFAPRSSEVARSPQAERPK